ncbi:class II lanthipeptide, LchA2/BrtA2 family [Paenibacillus ehimensis]|uniref:class II lanthipeptide, LchA2/BrtA2 family n=1 Tax=Paenibacillus ehimensis TaxID=79264 RepID=UPI000FDC6556|nr:class II lanthipeptide, LchA2/BrtA2 family [Paenibacillus ehimensis]
MQEQKDVFVSKVSEEELKALAGGAGADEVTPQSTIVCASLRVCTWSIKYCPSFKVKCPM